MFRSLLFRIWACAWWRKGASFLQQLGLKVLTQRRPAAELRETNLKLKAEEMLTPCPSARMLIPTMCPTARTAQTSTLTSRTPAATRKPLQTQVRMG